MAGKGVGGVQALVVGWGVQRQVGKKKKVPLGVEVGRGGSQVRGRGLHAWEGRTVVVCMGQAGSCRG